MALAGLLLVLHGPEMIAQARQYRFPSQVQTLAALDRLAVVCRTKGITREQAVLAVNAFRPRWAYGTPRTLGVNPLLMLPETAERPRLSNAEVRATVWTALTPADRDLLSVGMNVSRSLVPLEEVREADTAAVGRLVSLGIGEQGAGQYGTHDWGPSFLEYELPAATGPASEPPPRFLLVPGTPPGNVTEVWWSEGHGWQETRSLVWFTDTSKPAKAWALQLSDLPQWDPARVRRVRLVFRWPGIASVGLPRLIR